MLVNDLDIGLSVVYRSFQGETFTPSTGAGTSTFTDYTIQIIQNAISAGEIRAAGGLYQMGDIRFLIARSTLPVSPSKEDLILLGAETYNLVKWDTDPLNLLWRLVARKVS